MDKASIRLPRTGTILALVILFGLSATSRVASTAMAQTDSTTEPQTPTFQPYDPDYRSNLQGEFRVLFDAVRERETALEAREAEIDKREARLKSLQEELRTKLNELETAEEELRATLSMAETASEDDVQRLVAVYENMKPKQAAGLFSVMDPNFAAGFLSRMKPETAAGILSQMTPEQSYTISAVLAGRHANVNP